MPDPSPLHRTLTIVARDPSVERDGRVLLARVEVPRERLAPGPRGHRVQVVDVDSATGLVYQPRPEPDGPDPFAAWLDDPSLDRARLLADPTFHQQNAYAVVMRTLALFERALGRRVPWGFPAHQLTVAPHAFVDANAFYSREHQALMFGYFKRTAAGKPPAKGAPPEHVFLCLSHDVVAHETTHALVDGLRPWYLDPSSPDQAAFHEAFADLVALLSFFSLPEVTGALLDPIGRGERIRLEDVTREALARSVLLAVGKELAEATSGRDRVLRRSVEIEPAPDLLQRDEFQEPHRRGEVLVAAVLDGFLRTWVRRLGQIADQASRTVSRERAVEDGAVAAERLLRSAIRALDYAPPVDLTFGDFLSALLTSDAVIHPADEPFRALLLERFGAYGIPPAAAGGTWEKPDAAALALDGVHFEALQRDPQEVFRFLWENRGPRQLDLEESAETRVTWVQPCQRLSTDGFVLRETVAEYVQRLTLRADELPREVRPPELPADLEVRLSGGGTLVFDEFGRLRFHVHNRIFSAKQKARLGYLWEEAGVGDREALRAGLSFSDLHRRRLAGTTRLTLAEPPRRPHAPQR